MAETPQVGERASASASSRDVFVGGCPDCGGCAHGPDGRCPLDLASASSSGGEWLEIVERFAEATKDRRTIRDAYAAECLRRIVGKVSSPSAALPDVRALRDPKRFGVEALIAVAEGRYANIPDGTVLRPSRLTNAFLDGAQYVLAELEAALRSRPEPDVRALIERIMDGLEGMDDDMPLVGRVGKPEVSVGDVRAALRSREGEPCSGCGHTPHEAGRCNVSIGIGDDDSDAMCECYAHGKGSGKRRAVAPS